MKVSKNSFFSAILAFGLVVTAYSANAINDPFPPRSWPGPRPPVDDQPWPEDELWWPHNEHWWPKTIYPNGLKICLTREIGNRSKIEWWEERASLCDSGHCDAVQITGSAGNIIFNCQWEWDWGY